LTNKVATAIGTFLVGLFLSANGMQADFAETPTMIFWLRMFFGPAIGTLNLVGLAIFMLYPYNRDEHKRIQAELEQRKAASGD
jgi:Na+/melibiose symporter-like transporter